MSVVDAMWRGMQSGDGYTNDDKVCCACMNLDRAYGLLCFRVLLTVGDVARWASV